MASFHASTSSVSRGVGHSSCAKSAYISGQKLTNEQTGEIHDYTNRRGVEYTEIILPSNIDRKISAEELWNKAELAENRKDARVGREWVIALPHELNQEQRKELAQELAKNIADNYQVGTQIAIHAPSNHGDDRNYHVHILTTTRKLDKDLNLTEKSNIELSNKKCLSLGIKTTDEQIKEVREKVATLINQHLEKAQINEKVSHLSYQEQGSDKIPTKHLGKSATFLERKGINTEIGDYNRLAMRFNGLATTLKSIHKHELVQSHQPPQKNAPEALKSSLQLELSATEKAKLYLQKRAEEKNKPEISQETQHKPLTEEHKTQLLNEILNKRSYEQIIERQRAEKEKRLEKEQEQKQEYQKGLSNGRGFSR